MLFKTSILLLVAYIVISIAQFSASVDGLVHFFDLNWFFAMLAGLLLVFVPAIGPLAGVYGAVVVWQWSPLAAFCLFFWHYILAFLFICFGQKGSMFLLKRYLSPFSYYTEKNQEIEPEFNVKETKSTSNEKEVLSVEFKEK